MENTFTFILNKDNIKTAVFDIICIGLMYLVPAASHTLSVPLYLAEPLRIMIVIAMLHTKRDNAFFIALTLPLFSALLSGHPFFAKMIVVSLELFLNVVLFFYLSKKIKRFFLPMVLSIVISKIFYYLCEFIFLRALLSYNDIGDHPYYIQAVLAVVLGGYAFWIMRRRELKTSKP